MCVFFQVRNKWLITYNELISSEKMGSLLSRHRCNLHSEVSCILFFHRFHTKILPWTWFAVCLCCTIIISTSLEKKGEAAIVQPRHPRPLFLPLPRFILFGFFFVTEKKVPSFSTCIRPVAGSHDSHSSHEDAAPLGWADVCPAVEHLTALIALQVENLYIIHAMIRDVQVCSSQSCFISALSVFTL